MPKRPKRKKAGRPATGHDPILGVRVSDKIVRKIDRLAQALFIDRSKTVRRLLLKGLEAESWLLRAGKGRGLAGQLVAASAAHELAKAAEAAIARAKGEEKIAAEIKAHRARSKAAEMLSSVGDRVALQGAKRPAPRPREEPPHTSAYKPAGSGRGRLNDAEVKAVADRAEARRRQRP